MASFAKGDVVEVALNGGSVWCLATLDEVGTKAPITYKFQLDDPAKGYFGPGSTSNASNIRQPSADVLQQYTTKQQEKARYKPGDLVQVQLDPNDPNSWVNGEYLEYYPPQHKFYVSFKGKYWSGTNYFNVQSIRPLPDEVKQRLDQIKDLAARLNPGDPIEVQVEVPGKGPIWVSGTFNKLSGEQFYADYFWTDPSNWRFSGTGFFEYKNVRLPVPAGQTKPVEEPRVTQASPAAGNQPTGIPSPTGQPPKAEEPGVKQDGSKTGAQFAGIPFDVTRELSADRKPRIVPLVRDNMLYICWQDTASPTIYLHRMAADSNKLSKVAQLPSLGLLGGCTVDNSGHFYILTTMQEEPPNQESPEKVNWLMSRRSDVAKLYKVDPNGKLLKAVDLNEAKYTDDALYGMLNWGTGRLAYGNGIIAGLFSRRSYSKDDNLIHQISAFLALDENLDPISKAMHAGVSHSFDQRLIFDGDSFVLLHEGDTYPNPGLLIQKAALSTTADGKKQVQSWRQTTRTPYTCPTSANETYITVGDVAVGKNGYVVVFASSTHQRAPIEMLPDMAVVHVVKGFEKVAQPDARKIGRDLVDSQGIQEDFTFTWYDWNKNESKYNLPKTATISRNVIWFPDDQAYQDTRPKLAKLGDDKFVAIWERWPRDKQAYESTWAVLLNEMGEVQQPLKKVCAARLNPGDDAFTWQGKAAWLTGDALNKQINLHLIDENLNCSTTPLDLTDTPAPPSAKDVQTAELYENQWNLAPQETVEYEFEARPYSSYRVNVVSDAFSGTWTIKKASQSEADKQSVAIVKSDQAGSDFLSIGDSGTYHIKVQGADANAHGVFILNILPNLLTLGENYYVYSRDNSQALTFNAKANETYRIRLASDIDGVLEAGEQSFSTARGKTIYQYVSPAQGGAYKLKFTVQPGSSMSNTQLMVDLVTPAKLGDNRGAMDGEKALFRYKATLNNGYVITPLAGSHLLVNDVICNSESAAVFAESHDITIERRGGSSGDPYDFNLKEIEAPAAPGSTNPITINGPYRGHCIVKNGGTVTYNLTIKPNTAYEFSVNNEHDHAHFTVNGAEASWGLYTLSAGRDTNCKLIVGPISVYVDEPECYYCYEVIITELPSETPKLAEGVTSGFMLNSTPIAYKFEAQPQTAYKISLGAIEFGRAVFTLGDTKLAQVGNEFVGYFYNDSDSAKLYDVQVNTQSAGQTGAFAVKIEKLGQPLDVYPQAEFRGSALAGTTAYNFTPVATKVYQIMATLTGGDDPALIINNMRMDLSHTFIETYYFYADTAAPCLIIIEGGSYSTLIIKLLN